MGTYNHRAKHEAMKELFKMSHTPTYIYPHTPSCLRPRDPDRGLVGLFTGKGKTVARQPSPSNLLGSLELADIWPAWLTVVHKGDHGHNPLWPLLSCCNRYQTGLTHIPQSYHLSHTYTHTACYIFSLTKSWQRMSRCQKPTQQIML